jgi:hypothetical protein
MCWRRKTGKSSACRRIAEEDETFVVDSLLGQRCFERRRGEHCTRRASRCRCSHARADRDDRERFCLLVRDGTVAVSLSARADDTPSGRHNDQVNSTLQFPDWFKRGSAHCYRMRAEAARPAGPTRATRGFCAYLPAPVGSTCCILKTPPPTRSNWRRGKPRKLAAAG